MLLELLEHSHILDYIEQHSGERGGHDGRGGSRGVGGVTWDSLFRSVVGFIARETEAIHKLEEKGSGSATAQSNRLTKKKVLSPQNTTCLCTYTHMYTHIHTYTHVYTCTYIYTVHTYTLPPVHVYVHADVEHGGCFQEVGGMLRAYIHG